MPKIAVVSIQQEVFCSVSKVVLMVCLSKIVLVFSSFAQHKSSLI